MSSIIGYLGLRPRLLARFPLPSFQQVRTATKKAGGTTKNHGGSPGQRLGVKKFSDEWVIPGNIIVRQRGTKFHAGQHIQMGRDHTLYAGEPGYVRYYTQVFGRFRRRYVGLVMNRGETLPRDEASLGRSRYFGLQELNGVQQQGSTH